MESEHLFDSILAENELQHLFREVQSTSETLGEPPSDADATVQSMPDAGPSKWHLAQTSWFFEAMVLTAHLPGYQVYVAGFSFLFNSYYKKLGARQPVPAVG